MDFVWVLCRTDDGCGPPLQAFDSEKAAATAIKLMAMAYAGVQMFKVPVWPNVTGEAHPEPVRPSADATEPAPVVAAAVPAPQGPWKLAACEHDWVNDACAKCGEKL